MSSDRNSLYDPKSPPRGLSKIGLSEKRFPLKTRHEIPAISELWRKSKQMTWDPVTDIPYDTFDRSKYSKEQLDAARLGWSRRAWTEYTGIIESPAMLIRLSLDGQAPIEAKFVLAAESRRGSAPLRSVVPARRGDGRLRAGAAARTTRS